MTARSASDESRRRKGDLVRSEEIQRVITLHQQLGLPIGAVDIRRDGITIHPPQASEGASAYDQWKGKDANRGRPAHS